MLQCGQLDPVPVLYRHPQMQGIQGFCGPGNSFALVLSKPSSSYDLSALLSVMSPKLWGWGVMRIFHLWLSTEHWRLFSVLWSVLHFCGILGTGKPLWRSKRCVCLASVTLFLQKRYVIIAKTYLTGIRKIGYLIRKFISKYDKMWNNWLNRYLLR